MSSTLRHYNRTGGDSRQRGRRIVRTVREPDLPEYRAWLREARGRQGWSLEQAVAAYADMFGAHHRHSWLSLLETGNRGVNLTRTLVEEFERLYDEPAQAREPEPPRGHLTAEDCVNQILNDPRWLQLVAEEIRRSYREGWGDGRLSTLGEGGGAPQ